MKTKIINAVLFPFFLLVFPIWVAAGVAYEKPKLILQITVDQLRGDLPTRYYDRLGEGGLRYLLDEGVVFNNAHHAHANLFAFIDQKIGLDNTLIVLSADHGSPEAPGYLKSLGIPTGYVSPDTWDKQPSVDRIKSKFGISGKLIEGYDHPYLYLSNEVIDNSEVNLLALEAAIVDELVRFPGVSTAVSSTALARGVVADNYLTRAMTNNYHPKRSGNIYVVFDPGWFINDLDGLSAAVVHGSPWPYDTFVPIIFAGYKLKPQTVSRRVHAVDVASTLANIVGANPPSGASGEVLLEVLGQKP